MMRDIMNIQSIDNDVTLLVVNDSIDEELMSGISERIKVVQLRRPVSSYSVLHLLRISFFLNFYPCDVIHCHDQTIAKHAILCWRRLSLTIHNTGLRSFFWYRFSRLYAISNAVYSEVPRRLLTRCILVYNGVDASRIQNKEVYSFGGVIKIVCVARLLHEQKGQDVLICALPALIEKLGHRNVKVDMIGAGPSENFLKSLVRDLGLDDVVSFLGSKSREYVNCHLCEYDLFVLPSRFEGFGLTVVEAIVAGVPVLVSNIEGPLEILAGGVRGSVFEAGNSNDCSRKLYAIFSNYARCAELAVSVVDPVRSLFDIEACASRYINGYRHNGVLNR